MKWKYSFRSVFKLTIVQETIQVTNIIAVFWAFYNGISLDYDDIRVPEFPHLNVKIGPNPCRWLYPEEDKTTKTMWITKLANNK